MTKEQENQMNDYFLELKERGYIKDIEDTLIFKLSYEKAFSLQGVGCSLPIKKEINFDGNVLTEIETTDSNLKVLRAVNGWGKAIDVAKIQIVDK